MERNSRRARRLVVSIGGTTIQPPNSLRMPRSQRRSPVPGARKSSTLQCHRRIDPVMREICHPLEVREVHLDFVKVRVVYLCPLCLSINVKNPDVIEPARRPPSPPPPQSASLFSPPSMFGQLSNSLTAVVGQQAKVVKKSGWGGLFGGWGDSQPEEPVYQPPPPPPARESIFNRNRAQAERSPMPLSPQTGHQRGVPSFGGPGVFPGTDNRVHRREEHAQPASPVMQTPLPDRKTAETERSPLPASPRAGHQKGLPSLGGSGGAFSGMDSLDPSSAATGYHPHPHPAPAAPPSPKPANSDLWGLDMGQTNGGLHPDPEGVWFT